MSLKYAIKYAKEIPFYWDENNEYKYLLDVLIVYTLSVLLLSTTIRIYFILPVRIPFKAMKKIVRPRDLSSSFLLEDELRSRAAEKGFVS